MTEQEIESHYDIHTAFSNTFLKNSCAILILEGYMMALIKQMNTFLLTHMPETFMAWLILMVHVLS